MAAPARVLPWRSVAQAQPQLTVEPSSPRVCHVADPSSASLPRSHRPVTRPFFGVDSIVESGGIAEDYLYDDDEDEYYEEDGEEYYGVDEYYDGLDFGESALVLDRDRVSAPINDRNRRCESSNV